MSNQPVSHPPYILLSRNRFENTSKEARKARQHINLKSVWFVQLPAASAGIKTLTPVVLNGCNHSRRLLVSGQTAACLFETRRRLSKLRIIKEFGII